LQKTSSKIYIKTGRMMAFSPELYQQLHAAPVAVSYADYEQYFLLTYISAPVCSQMSNIIILALTNRHINLC
jgi:hypothetical protein